LEPGGGAIIAVDTTGPEAKVEDSPNVEFTLSSEKNVKGIIYAKFLPIHSSRLKQMLVYGMSTNNGLVKFGNISEQKSWWTQAQIRGYHIGRTKVAMSKGPCKIRVYLLSPDLCFSRLHVYPNE